jgi:excisionase family DNA binding protein
MVADSSHPNLVGALEAMQRELRLLRIPPELRLLTLDEVAETLRCSRRHVERLIESGLLTACHLPSPTGSATKTRVQTADLQSFIQSSRIDPGESEEERRKPFADETKLVIPNLLGS